MEDKEEPPLHPILEAIKNDKEDDIYVIQKILDEHPNDSCLEIGDNAGMTPLMQAAWKGKPKIVKFLIDQGADVNGGQHEHDYSALHFAALAGKAEVCRILVEKGAKVDHVNGVKRTASQMAAFVGNSSCVSIINNFVPKEDVFYYTRKQPLETEPKLPFKLAKPIHDLVMSMNTHPVRIGMILKDSPILLESLPKVCQILELMSDREFKNRNVNEILSLKYHIIFYILKDIKIQTEKEKKAETKAKTPLIDRWIKSMLLGRDSDGYPVFQEDFLRQGIKEFPYKESNLFKMLVTNFSHSKSYGYDSASAAEYINQAFNGQKGFKDSESCYTCGNEKAEKTCSSCKCVQYCDQNCQKFHWFTHKKVCKVLKQK